MRRPKNTSLIISIGTLLLTLILFGMSQQIQAAEVLTLSSNGTGGVIQGYAGSSYSAQFTVSGAAATAPYLFDFAGTLPPGTTALNVSGEITGTPTTPGEYPITVTVTDADGDTAPPLNVTLCIGLFLEPNTPILEPVLPAIVVKKPYSTTLTSKCIGTATVTYSIIGSLPTGISLNPTTGVISGTTNDIGTFSFTITATDSNGEAASRNYKVTSAEPIFSYSPANLPNGTADLNITYNSNHTVNGGTAPYTIVKKASSVLPSGFVFTASAPNKFNVTGKTNVPGSYQLDLTITDATGVSKDISFPFIISAPNLTITPGTLPNATQGVNYSVQLVASGGNGDYIFSLASGQTLPNNFTLSPTGLIDIRNPGPVGNFSITIHVEDSGSPKRTADPVYNLVIVGGLSAVYGSNPVPGSTISFGLVTVPGSSIAQTLSITNSGSVNLTISVPDNGSIFTGANPADFKFAGSVQPPTTTSQPPLTLSSGGSSLSLVIVCQPANTLFVSTAVMTFKTNDPNRTTVSYILVCNQVTPTGTPGVGTPTAVFGTVGPSVQVLSRQTAVVTEAPDTFATVTFVKGLSLRSGPYLGATMLGVIRPKKDYPVLALNAGDGDGEFNWYLLVDEDNKRIGWASGRYLILKGDPNIPFTPTIFDQIDNAKDFGVRLSIYGNVNIRARPSERMPVIHTTAYGTELEVIGRTYQAGIVQWVQVRFYDSTTGRAIVGWIYYNFNAPDLMELKGIVPLDSVPIR